MKEAGPRSGIDLTEMVAPSDPVESHLVGSEVALPYSSCLLTQLQSTGSRQE